MNDINATGLVTAERDGEGYQFTFHVDWIDHADFQSRGELMLRADTTSLNEDEREAFRQAIYEKNPGEILWEYTSESAH